MSTTNTNIVRVTKAQKYNAAIALLEGKAPTVIPGKDDKLGVTMDAAYLCDFFRAEIAQLAKKNTTTGKKKLTKAQEQNEVYKGIILNHLAANPKLVVTATDVMENVLRPAYPDELWSNQKAAALLNAMCDKYDKTSGELVSEGKLTRTEGKGKNKTTFQIKPDFATSTDEADGE